MNNQFAKKMITGVLFTFSFSILQAQQTDSLVGDLINVSRAINTTVIAQSLNAKVNSPYVESGPMLTKDGKRLYFSRHGHPENTGGVDDQDIWFSEFDDASQSWSDAINIGKPLNNAGPNFICGVGTKGDTVLLGNVYLKNGKMKAGISLSILKSDVWSFPVPVYVGNDYNLSAKVSYDLSHDRKALIIAEEKVDSHGKLDLYIAFRDKKHKYSGTESINLGPVINSFGNETSPFLAYDGRTLYFSSDGYNGFGSLDVFMSKRLDSTWTNWSVPENLGPGINTAYDDSYFGFTPNNRFAYYSRGLSPTNSDIYQVDMTYLFKSDSIPMSQLKENENPANVGQTKVVNHVFTGDSKDINKDAIAQLDLVVQYMQKYKTMALLISAHSAKHPTRIESGTLSIDRAKRVMDYFIKNGVEKQRLSWNGFGHDIVVNISKMSPPKDITSEDIASSVEFRYVGITK